MRKLADKCGEYLTTLGNESGQLINSITYERWLVLSALVVVFGFLFLRNSR